MILQGLSPPIWGALADTFGRRIIFIATMLVYTLSSLVLSITNSFGVLFIFRLVVSLFFLFRVNDMLEEYQAPAALLQIR